MSQHLQSAYHPDADQISAFLEQALPAHERELVLDHLALCPECRAVVALSLPEIEEPAQSRPTPIRKPWWSGWMLAWPLAGALTAAGFVAIYVHYARNLAVALQQHQIAIDQPPPAVAKPPAPQTSGSPVRSRTEVSQAAAKHESTASGAAMVGSVELDRQVRALGGVASTTGRNMASLKAPESAMPKVASAPPARVEMAPVPGYSQGLGGRLGPPVQTAAPPAPTETATASRAAPAPQTEAANELKRQSAATTSVRNSATETVTVSNDSRNIDTPTLAADAADARIRTASAQIAGLVHFKRPLPSHLPAISSVMQAEKIVAIDTENVTFVSKDAGKHWKRVGAPWPGRAVTASLVRPQAGTISGLALNNSANSNFAYSNRNQAQSVGGPLVLQNQQSIALPQAILTGTVADATGAVIPGASIKVTDVATGQARTVKTDSSGKYMLDGLPAAHYKVEAQSPGFQQASLDRIEVAANNANVADFKLQVSAISQTVEVSAENEELAIPAATAKPVAKKEPAPIFEITTDTGDRWTSADGLIWKRQF